MTKQRNVLNNSLTLLTTLTNSITPSTISPILSSISSSLSPISLTNNTNNNNNNIMISSSSSTSSSSSFNTKLPKEPPPNKQTKKHHRKLSLLYKQVEHLELKLLFKRAFIERELLCKLELAKKIKDEASELELNTLIQLNKIRSKIILLQNNNELIDNKEINNHKKFSNNIKNINNKINNINNNNFSKINNKKNSSCSNNKLNKNNNSLSKKYNNFNNDNQFDEKNFLTLSEERLSNSSIQVDICFNNLSLDELIILLDQKEKEMNFAIQSSQNQIEDLLKDAYDYLEEEEYLKLDIQDIKLEIDDLETMCI